jgi:hypothetical protein
VPEHHLKRTARVAISSASSIGRKKRACHFAPWKWIRTPSKTSSPSIILATALSVAIEVLPFLCVRRDSNILDSGEERDGPAARTRARIEDRKPYYSTEIPKRYLRTSGCCVVPCPTCGVATGEWCVQSQPTANGKRVVIHELRKPAAGKFADIGWHTFRHTYRSWLDETGAPMKVQQELIRHASIQTTMNVYGQAMPESKREANGKVVTMVLKPLRASA